MLLGLFTLNVFYLLLSYTATFSSAVLITSTAPNTPAILATSRTTPSSSHTKSRTTSHIVPPASYRPHIPSSLPNTHPRPTSHPWTPPPPPPATTSSPSQPLPHHLKPVVVVAMALGGAVGLSILFCIIRCIWSWQKTPRQNRIAGLLNRYNLEREMEEAAVEPRTRVPPPPYFPPPPEYATMMPSSPPAAHTDDVHTLPDRDEE